MSPDRPERKIPVDPEQDEPVFRTPWEARVFSIAVSLSRHGLFTWEEFRQRLIAEIARPDASEDYYQNWLRALEGLLDDKGTLISDEIERELAALQANPPAPQRHSHQPDKPLRVFPPIPGTGRS
jgi:nitrile hydratase accessory protein